MALTLMFFEAHSFASAFVIPATPCLAAVYAGIVQPALEARQRGDVDDLPAALPDHHPPGLLAQLEDPGQHQAQDRVPLLDREIQRALAVLNARAVHQDVQPPETLDDFRDHLRPLRAVGQVRLHVEQLRAGGGRLSVEPVRVRMARRDGHLRLRARQPQRHRPAEPAPPAGHQRHLARDIEPVAPLELCRAHSPPPVWLTFTGADHSILTLRVDIGGAA